MMSPVPKNAFSGVDEMLQSHHSIYRNGLYFDPLLKSGTLLQIVFAVWSVNYSPQPRSTKLDLTSLSKPILLVHEWTTNFNYDSFMIKQSKLISFSLFHLFIFYNNTHLYFLMFIPEKDILNLDRHFELRYLFLSKICHMPSSLSSLNNPLLSKHLFVIQRYAIPKPPSSFGWHKISNLARW